MKPYIIQIAIQWRVQEFVEGGGGVAKNLKGFFLLFKGGASSENSR